MSCRENSRQETIDSYGSHLLPAPRRAVFVLVALALLGMMVPLGARPAEAGQIAPELAEALDRAAPDEFVDAIVLLREKPDVRAQLEALEGQPYDRALTHRLVVEHLMDVASRTQEDLLRQIQDYADLGLIEEYHAFWIVNAVHVKARPEAIEAVAARREVGHVIPDMKLHPPRPVPGSSKAAAPDSRGVEWGVSRIRADDVWNDFGYKGDGVIVCIIDTGVDGAHDALLGQWVGQGSGTRGRAWFDPWGIYTFPIDDEGHGTGVAGIICGEDGDNKIGVAPEARWIAANLYEVQNGEIVGGSALALQCLNWACDPDGDPATIDDVPHVVNNSWGAGNPGVGYCGRGDPWWGPLEEAIVNLEGAGSMVVFSAGNEGDGASTTHWPASSCWDATTVFAVGATNSGDNIAGFSSRGPSTCACAGGLDIKPEVSAPGEGIRSARVDGGYESGLDGTSFAAPHVTGALAILRGAFLDAHPTELKTALMSSAVDLGDAGEDNDYGWGRIDVYEAYFSVSDMDLLDTLFVDQSNTDTPWDGSADHPFQTINRALELVPRVGTTYIKVAPGTYTEDLYIPDRMGLLGAGAATTIIDGGGTGNVSLGYGTHLSGFTIRNAANAAVSVWLADGFPSRIDSCVIEGSDFGIYARTQDEPTAHCNITRCVIWGSGIAGIYAGEGTYGIWNNTIDGHATGLQLINADATIRSNLFTNGYRGMTCTSSEVNEHHNGFWNNIVQDRVGDCGPVGTGDQFYNPFYMDAGNHDYRIMAGSPYVGAGYLGVDVGALPFVASTLVASPTGLTAQGIGQDGEIRFSWNPVSGAHGYQVYYGRSTVYNGTEALEGPAPILIPSGTTTSIDLTGFTNGVQYYLDVTAVDATLLESDLTAATYATVTPVDQVPPDYPVALSAVAGDSSVSLSWTNPSTEDWAGTLIKRNTSTYPTEYWHGEEVYSGTGTSVVDEGRANGTAYFYTAFAYDEVPNYTDGNCGSCKAYAIPLDEIPPSPPRFITTEVGDGEIGLTWSNPADPDWSLTRILRRTGTWPTSASDPFAVTVYEGTGTQLADAGLINGTTYYYGAFARDEAEAGNWSSVSGEAQTYGTPHDVTPPVWNDGDGLDYVTSDVGQVTLFWNAATDSASPPEWYNVYYDTIGSPLDGTKLAHVPASPDPGSFDLTYTATGLTNGREYQFLVRAEDDAAVPNETTEETGMEVWVEYRTPGWVFGTGQYYTLDDLVTVPNGAVEQAGSPSDFIFFGEVIISTYDTLEVFPDETLISADKTGQKKMVVHGTLIVDGGKQSSYATFTGLGTGAGEKWGGLELGVSGGQGAGLGSLLDHVIVERCNEGVQWYGGQPEITNSIIRHVTQTGLVVDGDPDTLRVEGNTIHDCGSAGIDCSAAESSWVWIDDNDVYDNDGYGIILISRPYDLSSISDNTVYDNGAGIHFAFAGGVTQNDSLWVRRNHVYGNTGDGLDVGQTGMSTLIYDNTITGNGIGIDFIHESVGGARPIIRSNSVMGNHTAGIRCGYLCQPLIDSCEVSSNVGPGILSVNWAYPYVTNTTLTGNLVGVRCEVESGPGWMDLGDVADTDPLNDGGNQIHDNTSYDVQNLTPNMIKAQNNWWGASTALEMSIADAGCPGNCLPGHGCGQICNISTIWDVHDSVGLGMVDFATYPGTSGDTSLPYIDLTSPAGEEAADTSFEITWVDWDTDQDATISLFYFREGSADSLLPIPGASALSEDDTTDLFVWNTAAVDTGIFYLRATITDGWESDSSDAAGFLTIDHPFVAVDTTTLLAVVRAESTTTLPFGVESVGGYDLTFLLSAQDSLGGDLSWASASPCTGTVSPGDTAATDIVFDAAALSPGMYGGRLVVGSNDPWSQEVQVGLQMMVTHSSLALAESSHDFGVVLEHHTRGWELRLTNTGDDTLHLYSADAALADYWVDPPAADRAVPPGAWDTLHVHFSPAGAGDRADTLWIGSDAPENGGLAGVSLEGIGVFPLSLSAGSLDFGQVPMGDVEIASLWATNEDTASFSIVTLSAPGPYFAVVDPPVPYELQTGGSVEIVVEFSPTHVEHFSSTLTVGTNHQLPVVRYAGLDGEGTQPSVELSTTTVDFGIVALGDTATANLWARNAGGVDVVLEDAQISDPAFEIATPGFPTTVPPWDSALVGLRFVPGSPGPVSGVLTLTSDDPFHEELHVNLSGSGPVPDILLPLPYVFFGEAVVGVDTLAQTLAVANVGLANLEVAALSVADTAFTILTSTPFSVVPGDTSEVSLLFHPQVEDDYGAFLVLETNDPDPWEDSLLVDVTGAGVIPVLALLADTLAAEAWEDGTAEESLFVWNSGTGTLIFESTEADTIPTDLPWLDATPDSGAIAAGDTLALALNFDAAPVGHGVHYGNLLFSSNDPAAGVSEVAAILRVPRMHYADLDTGNVLLGVTDEGAFGYFDKPQRTEYGEGRYGGGVRFPVDDEENHLFAGCVWLGVDSNYVADASYDYDWEIVPDGALAVTHEGGNQVARASWNDAHGATPLDLTVHMTATAAPDAPNDDYILIHLAIENTTASQVDGLYAGFYFDWDTGTSGQNEGGYSDIGCVGYMYDAAHPESTYVGIAAIEPWNPTSFNLIHNQTWVWPYGAVRDQDAYAFMSGGVIDTATFEPTDWSMVMAAGPFSIAPAESAVFSVAVVAGRGLEDLRNNAILARSHFGSVPWGGDVVAGRFDLGPARPNPFNPLVYFDLYVPDGGGRVAVSIYDVRGRLVNHLFDGEASAGLHALMWHGRDQHGSPAASGIYFVRMVAGDEVRVRKAILLK